uniref:DUF3395 domain-containing protein n=1 Tax=Gongylonema pulchrum TaxID=637853 RepID=A0A183EVB1_9BILA
LQVGTTIFICCIDDVAADLVAIRLDGGGGLMAPKTKYVIVQLASVVSGSTRIWIRERAADKFRGIFYDPAVGREVLFEEKQKVKGKAALPDRVKQNFNLT